MKQAVVLCLAALAALLGVLYFLPSSSNESPDLLKRKDARPTRAPQNPRRDSVIDLTTARGEQVFMPHEKEIALGGETRRYTDLYVWCGSFAPIDASRFRFDDIRILSNREPKTADEFARLATIPYDLPLDELGQKIVERLDEGYGGVQAKHAIFYGGRDLESARRVELEEDVRLVLADRPGKVRGAEVRSRSLVIELDKGEIVRVSTDDEVTVTGPQGRISGRGLDGNPKSGAFTIRSSIDARLDDVSLLRLTGDALTLSSAGPLRYLPEEARDPTQRVGSSGTIVVENGVELRQGDASTTKGQKLTVVFGGTPVTIRSFVLDGTVAGTLPEGSFAGASATYTAGEQVGDAQLVLAGPGLRLGWKDGATLFPGRQQSGDLSITTEGRATLFGADAKGDVARRVVVGPEVELRTETTKAAGRELTIELHSVPVNKEGAKPEDRTVFPARIVLEGDARGDGPEGSFGSERLIYTRLFAEGGVPREDRIRLEGASTVVYALEAAPDFVFPAKPEDYELSILFDAPGTAHLRATKAIEVVRDPLKPRALVATADGSVVLRRLGPGGDDQLFARLNAEHAEIVLEEAPVEAPAPAAAKPRAMIRKATAEGEVAFAIPTRLDGSGGRLVYDGATKDLEFVGDDAKPAKVLAIDADGQKASITARSVSWQDATMTLDARGEVVADVDLPPFDLEGGGRGDPVPTHVVGTRVTARLAPDPKSPDRRRLGVVEVRAQGSFEATQESGSLVRGTRLRLEPATRRGEIEGTPARIDLVRVVEGVSVKDHLQSPSMVLLENQALVTGPIDARFHGELAKMAPRIDRMPVAERPPGTPPRLEPLDLVAAGDTVLTRQTVIVQGPLSLTQGDPAKDGFKLSGDKALLTLAETGVRLGDGPLDIVNAVVEGKVVYASPDIEGIGDVMEFDRNTKRLVLSSNGGSALLSHRGLRLDRFPRPAHILDFSRPNMPPFYESLDKPYRRDK